MDNERKIKLTVEPENDGARLDAFIASSSTVSRTLAQSLIANKGVFVNAQAAENKGAKLCAGDVVEFEAPQAVELQAVAQDIPLDIIYEDDDLLVVNKPKGMVVHPAAGNPEGTLVNALLFHCAGSLSGINGVLRPGIVHRIDKDTSGLLVVAKNDEAHVSLCEQIASHKAQRIYEAVVYGGIRESGTVDAPIGRSDKDRKKYCVTLRNSKNAVTHYEPIEQLEGFTHVRLRLETGRTHQIRVHMAHIGHPVAGDAVYGPKAVIMSLHGQCLHARTIAFNHPRTGEMLSFDSPLPEYFTEFERKLR